MAKPVLITVRDKIRNVAKSWRLTYGAGTTYLRDAGKQAILARLEGLDLEVATADDVAEIIGNRSWTDLRCSGCDTCEHERVVRVGEEPAYESNTAGLCRDCLREAAALMGE